MIASSYNRLLLSYGIKVTRNEGGNQWNAGWVATFSNN